MIVPSPRGPLLSLPANWFVVRSASLPLKSNPFLSPFSFLLFFEWGGRCNRRSSIRCQRSAEWGKLTPLFSP